MANRGDDITTKFSVDITELKAGIQEANRQIKLANSQFKAAASGMDDWGNSADGLQAKIEQLTKVHDAENKKLQLLQKQYAAVAEEQGENSAAAQNLQVKINNQQAAVNKTASELNKYQQRLDEVNSASSETAGAVEDQRSAYEKLQDTISDQEDTLKSLKEQYASVVLEQGKNSKEAKDLAKEIKALSGELSDNVGEMKSAESAADKYDKSLDDLGESAGDASGGFTILKGALAEFAGNVITSAVNGIKDFVGSLFELSEATEEYRSMMAKTTGSAESFGYSVEFATGKYQEFYKYLGDDQMATNAITNLMGMKVSTDTVSDAANAAIAVWSAYGDSIPIEGLTESINESAQVAQVTGSLADAINWAKRSNEDWSAAMAGHSAAQEAFNASIADGETAEDAYSAALAACADTQERADLIAQTLNQTFGKSKETYDQTASSILDANAAELELKDTQAQLGQAMEPVNTALTNLKTQALDAISPVVEKVAGKFLDFLNWMRETPGATSAVVSVVTGLATAFGILAAALAIQALINGVAKAFQFLNLTMLSNPFVLIATLIAGVVAALVTLYTTNEDFRNFVNSAWESIKTVVGGVIDAIVNFFTVTIPDAINGMISWFATLPERISLWLTAALSAIQTWVSNTIAKAIEMGSQFVQNVVNFFSTLPERIGYWIGFALGKVVQFGIDLYNFATTKIPEFVAAVIQFISELPGKIANWLTQAIAKVTDWGARMVSTGKQKASDFIDSVITFIQQLPGKISTWLTNTLNKVISWGSDMVSKGKQAASDMASGIVDAVQSLPGKMLSIGSDIVHGIWNGISGAAGWLWGKVKDFAGGIVDGFKDALGINSPSKVFEAESKWIPGGVGEGVENNEKLALNPVQKLTKKMRSAAKSLSASIIPEDVKSSLSSTVSGLKSRVAAVASSVSGTTRQARNIVFNQYNNSPKALSRLDIYRQTKSQLFSAKGRLANV